MKPVWDYILLQTYNRYDIYFKAILDSSSIQRNYAETYTRYDIYFKAICEIVLQYKENYVETYTRYDLYFKAIPDMTYTSDMK